MAIQARREILRRRYAIKTQSTGWTLEELTRLKTLALDQGLKAHEMLPLFPNRSWGAIRKQSWKMVVSNMAETKVKDKDNESKDFDNNDNKNINENVQARSKSEKTVPTPPVYRPTRARSWSTEEDHQILQEFDRFQKEKGGAWTLNELATELSKDLSLARSKLMLLERICRILPKAEIASRRDQATDMMEESRSRSQSHAWTAAEDRALVAAVEEQVGPNYAPRLSYLGQTSLVTRPHKGGHESQDKQRPFLTPNCEALERIDWHKIEGQLETRTWSAARTRFYESLSIRKLDRWSTDEVKRLKEALAKHGFDSMALHRDLVVRSPHQCAHKLYSLHRYLRKTKE
ncbi:hypothetical protein BGZ83_006085 [Gryganskiella cystojenkinii]|nr:hypothetical protein BGZ83_006085 [Gryganskiella cystojenkinii]